MKVAILIKTVVGRALEQVIGICGEIEFIENPNEADLIVAEKANDVVNLFFSNFHLKTSLPDLESGFLTAD